MHFFGELPTARLVLGEISVNPGISACGRVSLVVRVLSLSLKAYAGSCGQVLHAAYPEPGSFQLLWQGLQMMQWTNMLST